MGDPDVPSPPMPLPQRGLAVARVAIRLAVGALGAWAIVSGCRIAWREKSSTTLLIVGAVLVVLALFADRLTSVRAKANDWELEVGMVQHTASTAIRTLFDNLTEAAHSVKDKLEELSGGEPESVTDDVPSELDELRDRLEAIEASASRTATAALASIASVRAGKAVANDTDVTVERLGNQLTFIVKRSSPAMTSSVLLSGGLYLEIETPDGDRIRHLLDSMFAYLGSWRVTYPGDIAPGDKLQRGTYMVSLLENKGGVFTSRMRLSVPVPYA